MKDIESQLKYRKDYYVKNKEKRLNYQKTYNKDNKEYIKTYQRKYYIMRRYNKKEVLPIEKIIEEINLMVEFK
jgi:hypothetical protein